MLALFIGMAVVATIVSFSYMIAFWWAFAVPWIFYAIFTIAGLAISYLIGSFILGILRNL